jgi:hypothetical protein
VPSLPIGTQRKLNMHLLPRCFSQAGRQRRLVWLLMISFAYTGSADPAVKDDSVPTDLKISTGTFFGAKFTLQLLDGHDLILKSTPGRGEKTESTIALHPSPEKWRAFRSSLDKLNVWSWKAEYVDTAAPTDGYSWRVELAYPDHKLMCHGYEAAPASDGSWSPMKGMNSGSDSTYSDFTKAVSALVDEPFY